MNEWLHPYGWPSKAWMLLKSGGVFAELAKLVRLSQFRNDREAPLNDSECWALFLAGQSGMKRRTPTEAPGGSSSEAYLQRLIFGGSSSSGSRTVIQKSYRNTWGIVFIQESYRSTHLRSNVCFKPDLPQSTVAIVRTKDCFGTFQ